MTDTESRILTALADAVIQMDEKRAEEFSAEAISSGIDAYRALSEGLIKGMETVGEQFDKGIVFVPEVLLASDALCAGLEVLKPHLAGTDAKTPHTVVIGVVHGDTHDIGKNIVKIMLETGGFRVIDLGRNVALNRFVEVAAEENAELIALSSLMTTTREGMRGVIQLLEQESTRAAHKVLIGGAAVSPGFARQIGADGYAANAIAAVGVARELVAQIVPAEVAAIPVQDNDR